MKEESLVIVDQHATVNLYSGFVHTARHGSGDNSGYPCVRLITKYALKCVFLNKTFCDFI